MGGDRISGGAPARDVDLSADLNPVAYNLNETLGQLKVSLKSRLADRPEVVLEIESGSSGDDGKELDFAYAGLKAEADNEITVDLSKMIAAGPADDLEANDTVALFKNKKDAAGTFSVAEKRRLRRCPLGGWEG